MIVPNMHEGVLDQLAPADRPAWLINNRRPSHEFVASRRANRERRRACGKRLGDMSLSEFVRTEYLPLAGGATNFNLTLDTTAPTTPTFTINGGAAYATAQAVTGNFSTADASTVGYQIKVWGNVDTTANANIQATEGASAWIAYTASQAVTLLTGDGSKTLSARIRDDVGNQTAILSASITLDTTLPVPNITVAASPTKISTVATFDTSTFTFQSDTAIQAWKVKVVPAVGSIESAGTLIPTTAGSASTSGGSLAAVTNQSVTIKGADLQTASAGDGAKIVKVFVQDLAGNWSV